jgi:hypothetical protein
MGRPAERTRHPIRVACADPERCGDFESGTLIHVLIDAILVKRRLIEAADVDVGIELRVRGRGNDAQVYIVASIVSVA